MKFNMECPRCDGTGRFDRGTCFECKGRCFVIRARRPCCSEHTVTVTFSNGSKNIVKMFGHSAARAVRILEREVSARGWNGAVSINSPQH